MNSTTASLSIAAIIKNSTYVLAFAAGAKWLGFDPGSLGILCVLMLVDIITAIFRVGMVEGTKNIRSSALRKGIAAKFLLSAGLFSIAITSKGVGFDMEQMAQGAVSVLMLGELYSILGNIHSARTGTPKVEYDAVAFLLSKVRDLLDKVTK